MDRTPFGTYNGKDFNLFKIKNAAGMEVSVTELGAVITSIKVPVCDELRECVLGFDDIESYFSEDYLNGYPYLGAVIGRNAGRISFGRFSHNNETIELTKNHGVHHLHGGVTGFDRKIWSVKSAENQSITLEYCSQNREEGYPGNLDVQVKYVLTCDNELIVQFTATTDADTIVNLTQHSYFNLDYGSNSDILSHTLQLNGERYVALTEELLPSGQICNVADGPVDYREARQPDPSLDQSFIIGDILPAGILRSSDGKLSMAVSTSQPVLHLYTGYFLPEIVVPNRKTIKRNAGICFEAQGFPDSPNHNFPSSLLTPGQEYKHSTTFKFISEP